MQRKCKTFSKWGVCKETQGWPVSFLHSTIMCIFFPQQYIYFYPHLKLYTLLPPPRMLFTSSLSIGLFVLLKYYSKKKTGQFLKKVCGKVNIGTMKNFGGIWPTCASFSFYAAAESDVILNDTHLHSPYILTKRSLNMQLPVWGVECHWEEERDGWGSSNA